MNDRIPIDICVCTFRRDHIVTTLESLAELDIPFNWDVRIILANNDDTRSAEIKVQAVSTSIRSPIIYLYTPTRNISFTRNAHLTSKKELVQYG